MTDETPIDHEKRSDAPVDSAARTERSLLALYIGPNSERFLRLYDESKRQGGKRSFAWSSANWIAGFLPTPWFFYRKLYLEGTALILLPVVITYLFPEWGGKGSTGFFVAIIFTANQYYLWRAERNIARIKASGVPESERDTLIQKSEGVSVPGAIVGAIVFAGLAATAIYSTVAAGARRLAQSVLPLCNSAEAKKTVEAMFQKGVSPSYLNDPSFKRAEFREVPGSTGDVRRCGFAIVVDTRGNTIPARFTIKWSDSDEKKPILTLGE